MASITQRGKRFLVRVRRDGYPTVTQTFTKRADAAAWGRQVEADMEAGRWALEAQAVPTLSAAIGEYRTTVAVRMKGAADYAYRFDIFEALPFAAKPINEVTPFDLSKWRDQLAKTRKPATVVRLLAMLSAVFTWAMKERGWIKSNPACMVARPRVLDRRERVLSDEERGFLMAAAATSKAAWLHPVLVLLMNSAMRRGEVFGLRRADVDFGASVARLADTKNGSAREVPLCPRSLTALRELAGAAHQEAGAALVPVGDAGSVSTRFVVTVRRARRAYEEACLEAGIEPAPGFLADARLHDLRHHAITQWATTGALSLPELMAVSGHKTPRMLTRYTHLSASALAGKLARVAA
jgi:integrase